MHTPAGPFGPASNPGATSAFVPAGFCKEPGPTLYLADSPHLWWSISSRGIRQAPSQGTPNKRGARRDGSLVAAIIEMAKLRAVLLA